MATLTFTYDTGSTPASKIVDAICLEYNYQTMIFDPQAPGSQIPNPETKANFARRMFRQTIVNIVKNQDLIVARKSAEAGVTEINLQ